MKKLLILLILGLSCIKNLSNLKIKVKGVEEDLAKAIIEDEKDKAMDLIKKLSNVNYKNSDNKSFLQLAIEKGNLDIIKALLNKGIPIENENDIAKIYDLAIYDNYGIVNIMNRRGYRLKEGLLEDNKYFCFLCYSTNTEEIKKFIKKKNINLKAFKDKHNRNCLIMASIGGKKDIVEMFIKEYKFGVNEGNNWGSTALIEASGAAHKDIVILLLDNGADINKALHTGWSALMSASEKGHKDVVKELLDRNADVNAKNYENWTALMTASYNGHIDIVRILIEKGANINNEDKYGWTALMYAIRNGHENIVKLLVEKGSNINHKNKEGWNSLMAASKRGLKDVVKILLSRNVDINAENCGNWTALMTASYNGHNDIVKILIEKGANINSENEYGWTSLMCAAKNGHKDIVKLLIEKGADINHKSKEKYTALMLASGNNHKEIVETLLENDANINDADNEGATSLIKSSYRAHKEIVKLLINKGASINDKKKDGQTALMFASYNGDVEIAKLLIENGANINCEDKNGSTALVKSLDRSLNNGRREIVKLLIENCCQIKENLELDNIIEEVIIENIKNKKVTNYLLIANNYIDRLNFNYRDSEGNTLLHYAAMSNNHKLFNLFLNSNIDINILNNRQETPLYTALSQPNINECFIWYLINNKALLKPNSYIKNNALVDVLLPYKEICNKLVYEPLIFKLLGNNKYSIDKQMIKEIIKLVKVREEDFELEKDMINFIRNVIINNSMRINLSNIDLREDDNQDIELNIEVFDEIFQHFQDENYWDSIINKAVEYVKRSYIKDLDKISLDYLDVIKNKGLGYAKANFNLDEDKKFNTNKLVKEKINYIKELFKDRLQKLKEIKPVNKSLVDMNKQEREQNTDFIRKKQLSNLLKIISLLALKGDNYSKIKYSINQILDAMVCREGSLEALEEAIRYISSGEIKEVDQSVKEILNEELMKLRYELFKEVVNEEINKDKVKLNIIVEGRKIEMKAEMVPELLPSILKTMHNELKIKLKYLDSDDNYNFVYDKNYIIEEVKRRYKDRIIDYIKDMIEEEEKNEKEKSRILWNKVRDYIERNIFKGRAILQVEGFIYDEEYKIKFSIVKALLTYLKFLISE